MGYIGLILILIINFQFNKYNCYSIYSNEKKFQENSRNVPVFQRSSVPVFQLKNRWSTKSHENFYGSTNNFQPGTLEHWNKVRVLSMTKST